MAWSEPFLGSHRRKRRQKIELHEFKNHVTVQFAAKHD